MGTVASDTFTGSNGAAWNSQWTTSAGNGGTATFTIQSNTGQWTVSVPSTYARAFLSGMSALTDCDFYCDFQASTNSVQNYLFFGVSVPAAAYESADPFFPNDGYGVQVTVATTDSASSIQLFRCSGGAYAAEGSVATVTVTAGSWYTVHVQRRGSTLNAFFYAQGGSEPGSPQCTFTDSSPLAGGKCLVTGAPESTSNAQAIDNVVVSDPSMTPIALAETGSGADSLTASPVTTVGVSDAGTGSDALTAAILTPLTEGGSGADALSASVATVKALSETGSGADAIAVKNIVALPDAASGADKIGPITAKVALAETGVGATSFAHYEVIPSHIATTAVLAAKTSTAVLAPQTATARLADRLGLAVLDIDN